MEIFLQHTYILNIDDFIYPNKIVTYTLNKLLKK